MSKEKMADRLEKVSAVAAKIGNQVHLRTLRDSFATLIPLYILAGISTLLSSSVFPLFMSGDLLASVTKWSTAIGNGTLNFSGVLICAVAGYFLARNKGFENKIACAVVSLSSLIVMMPFSVTLSLVENSEEAALVSGGLAYNDLGVKGLFAGIILGLVASELFIRVSGVKKLRINLGEGIPPAVADSFNVLVPMMIILAGFGVVSAVLAGVFGTDFLSIIRMVVQEPLAKLGTSLPAVLFIYSMGNLLFFFGIHQDTINGSLLKPILLVATTTNMAAAQAGEAIPNLITQNDLWFFGQLGGTGCTLMMMIAVFLVSKNRAGRAVTSMSVLPGLFNINEPMIFGYPIVYNFPLLIPFLGVPVLSISAHYFAQVLGLVSPVTVLIPWNTPPLISGFLSTGGDIRTSVLQLIVIVVGTLIYIPFVRMADRMQQIQMEEAAE